MKYKTSKKDVSSHYHYIISAEFCDVAYLVEEYNIPQSYCSGKDGWLCDNYDIGGVLISTGYGPISRKNTRHNYDLLCDYNNRARAIRYDYDLSHEDRKMKVGNLLGDFIDYCTDGGRM